MKRKNLIVTIVTIPLCLLCVAGLVFWRAAVAFETMKVEGLETITLAASADAVLDSSITKDLKISSGPLLDQYRNDPESFAQREKFVTTWVSASHIASRLKTQQPFQREKMLSSLDVANLPAEHRTDAWQNPYCIWITDSKIIILSSAVKATLDCHSLSKGDKILLRSVRPPKLVRTGAFLVTVQPLPKLGDASGDP